MRREDPLMWKLIESIPFAIPGARPFRRTVHNVHAVGKTGGHFRAVAGVDGQADVVVYLKGTGGRVVEVETKARDGRLRPEQKVWRDWCAEWGVPWLCLKEGRDETPEQTVLRWLGELAALVRGMA